MSSLTFRSGRITGALAGQFLQCFMNAAQPGWKPTAGEYYIQPPVQDPVFGPVAMVVPVNRQGFNTGTAAEIVWRSAVWDILGARSIASMNKQESPPSSLSAFVLSSRPIPGAKCLLVGPGFSELAGALQKQGGATITVY